MPGFDDQLKSFEDRYAVLRADSIEEVAAWMGNNFGPWRPDIACVNADQDVARFSRKDAAGISLATYRWEAGIEARVDAGEDVLFVAFPLQGQAWMHVEGIGTVKPGPNQARVYRRPVPSSTVIAAGYANLSLVVPSSLIQKRAQSYYEWAPDRPIDFSPLLDLDTPQGAAVFGLAKHIMHGLVANPGAYDNALIQAALHDMVSGVLLANLSHNAADGAPVPGAAPLPRTIRRAEDYMRAHAHEPITLADLAQAAGCGERALHDGFRKFRGKTPMMALRDIRLDGARRDLEQDNDSVTQIALKWGFSNLGRFAQAYARRFGEKPSETR